ncbi:hypothetical protein HPB51_011131 [Rhipicephalus microplus]|uniref:BTB domain-containing protein n=1 Tax=Rhipicephalus microplus TaxID=6941 RepID=A0A9J6E161_RHIMP|nr:hypothetical protein HPB51_011131 [Rhipicephalus microplus]
MSDARKKARKKLPDRVSGGATFQPSDPRTGSLAGREETGCPQIGCRESCSEKRRNGSGAWLLLLTPQTGCQEGDECWHGNEAALWVPLCESLGTTVEHVMGVGASSPDPPQVPSDMGRKKRAPLLTLRKRLARRRWRASKGFDHAQVFNDFLNSAGWTVREVAALVHDYEATGALRELTAHADAARPPARSCRADLGRLLESRLCTDVTLAYRGTAFPAHRALLSARCPFFRDLLSEGARQQMVWMLVHPL